jgi:O-antigen/teichoic acid export membrane protein
VENNKSKQSFIVWLGSIFNYMSSKVIKHPSIALNTVSNWLSLAINTFISFLLTPYIISNLGKEGYGIWVLVLSVVGYYGLLDMGLPSATLRYIARYAGQKDNVSVNKIVNTSLFIFILMGAFVIIVSILLGVPLTKFFKVAEDRSNSFTHMVWLVGIAAGLGFPRRLFDAILMAHEQFVICNILGVLLVITRALAMFSVLYLGYGIEAIGWVELSLEIFNIALKLFACVKITKGISFYLSGANKKTAWELFGFASLTFIALLGDTLRWNIDTLVIGRFLNLEAVGVYGVASILVRLLIRISSATSVSTYPRLSSLASGNLDTFRKKYLQYSQLTSLVVVGTALEIILLSKDMISLWVGTGFTKSIPVVIILTIALSFDYMTIVAVNGLKALNRQVIFAAQTIIEGGVNLLLSILLVKNLGLIGVALGTAIPMLFTKILIQPVYSSRIIGVRWIEYFLETIVKPLCLGIAILLLFFLSGFLTVCDSFVMLGLKGIVIGLVYMVSTVALFRNVQEEWHISNQLDRALKLLARLSFRINE